MYVYVFIIFSSNFSLKVVACDYINSWQRRLSNAKLELFKVRESVLLTCVFLGPNINAQPLAQ